MTLKELKKAIILIPEALTPSKLHADVLYSIIAITDAYNIRLNVIDGKKSASYHPILQRITICNKSSAKYLVRSFVHELAHHIQLSSNMQAYFDSFISFPKYLELELQAERLAYFIAKAYFPQFKLHHKEFNGYQSRLSKVRLAVKWGIRNTFINGSKS